MSSFSTSTEDSRRTPRGYKRMLVPAVALAAITVVIGLGGEPFFRLALAAADQLLDRAGYVAAVLGDTQ